MLRVAAAAALIGHGGTAAAGVPTLKTIAIETGNLPGTFDDWTEVLANPANTSLDGPGDASSICAVSGDADCPVPGGAGRDIYRFAWTYDWDGNPSTSFVYLYLERTATSNGALKVFFVADTDGAPDQVNGVAYLDPVDRVVQVDYGNTGVTAVNVCNYEPSNAACTDEDANLATDCDPLNAPTTRAVDGFDLAGKVSLTCDSTDYSPPSYQANGGDLSGGPDHGRRLEVKVPWSALGATAGTGPLPLYWHVTVNNMGNRVLAGEDNCGGTGNGDSIGSFGYSNLTLTPVTHSEGAPEGESASHPFTLTHTGTLATKADVFAVSSLGLQLEFRRTSDNALMALDGNGDGDFADTGDSIASGFDTNGNGRPDTVTSLENGQTFGVKVVAMTRAGLAHLTDTTVLTAVAGDGQTVTATALTPIGDVVLLSSQSRLGLTGGSFVVPYSMKAYNYSGASAVLNVSVTDITGDYGPFTPIMSSDTNCDGDDLDAGEGALTDTNSDGTVDLGTVANAAGACFLVKVLIPAGKVAGNLDRLQVKAWTAADAARSDAAVLTTLAAASPGVTPSSHGASGTELSVVSGQYRDFPFVITNSQASASTFPVCLGYSGSFSYTLRLYTDPNGDGSPADGVLVATVDTAAKACGGLSQFTWTTPSIAAYGGSLPLVLELEVPASEPPDTARTHFMRVVPGANQVDGTVYTRTRKIGTYSDAALRRPARTFAACDTVYIHGSGLADVNSTANYMLQIGAGASWASSWRCLKGPADAGDPYASIDGTCPADPARPCSVYQTTDLRGDFWDSHALPTGSATGAWTVALHNAGRCSDASETTSLAITVERSGTLTGPTATYPDFVRSDTGNDVAFSVVLSNTNTVALYGRSTLRYAVRRADGQYWNPTTKGFAAFASLASTATGSVSVGELLAGASVRLDVEVANVLFPDASETGSLVVDWVLPCTDMIAGPSSTNFNIRACAGDLDGDWCMNCNDRDFRTTSADGDGDGVRLHCDCNDANAYCTSDCTDADADGYCVTTDCSDVAGAVHPGAAEACDGIDNDCDGTKDEDCPTRTATNTPTATPADTATATDTPVDTATPTHTSPETPTQAPSPSPTPTFFLSGQILHYGNANPVAAVRVDGKLSFGGAVVASATTDSAGSFAMTAVTGPWALQPRLTDTDTSIRRALSSLDATWIQQYKVGSRTFDGNQLLAADASGNGSVSSLDATRIQEYRVRILSRLPVADQCGSDWAFVPVPGPQGNPTPIPPNITGSPCTVGGISYASLDGSAGGQDFQAVLFGDVTGNWTPPSGASMEMESIAWGGATGGDALSSSEPLTAAAPECVAPCAALVPGDGGVVLVVNAAAGAQAFDLHAMLPGGVEVSAVEQAELAAAALDCSLVWAAKDGVLRLSLACLTPVRGAGALLAVKVNGDGSGTALSKCVFDETEVTCRPGGA